MVKILVAINNDNYDNNYNDNDKFKLITSIIININASIPVKARWKVKKIHPSTLTSFLEKTKP